MTKLIKLETSKSNLRFQITSYITACQGLEQFINYKSKL